MKPQDAIKMKSIKSVMSQDSGCTVGLQEKHIPSSVIVSYLYQPGELEGGTRRATDPIWSLKTYKINQSITKEGQPMRYNLLDGPKHGFV